MEALALGWLAGLIDVDSVRSQLKEKGALPSAE